MPDPYVREIGRAEDSTDETHLPVGVDYDCVSIGLFRFTGEQLERFAQLFTAACWEAGRNKARMEAENADWARDDVNLALAGEAVDPDA